MVTRNMANKAPKRIWLCVIGLLIVFCSSVVRVMYLTILILNQTEGLLIYKPTGVLSRHEDEESQARKVMALNWPALEYFRDKTLEMGCFPSYKSYRWGGENKTLPRCLASSNVTKIAVLGDSNGSRFTSALLQVFRESGSSCVSVKTERSPNNHPDKTYFMADPYNVITTHERGCHGCNSIFYQCKVGDFDFVTENIAVEFTLDTEITTNRLKRFPPCGVDNGFAGRRPCRQSLTTQEFLFKEYFTSTGYPDLILWFSSAHDHVAFTADEMESAVHRFASLFTDNAPPKTQLIFFPKLFEETWKKPERWKSMIYENKYDILEQIQRLNNASVKGLEPYLRQPGCNIHPFFDLFSFEEERREEWAGDGVHKKPEYYTAVMQYFSKYICL